jgi:Subtilase family
MKYLVSALLVLVAGLASAQSVVSTRITYRTDSIVISVGTPTVVTTTNTDTQTVKQSDGSVVKNVYNLLQTKTTTPTTSQDKRYQITTVTLSDGTKQVTETLISDTVNTANKVTPSTVRTLASSTIITPSPTATVTPAPVTPTVTISTFNASNYYGNSPYMGTPTTVFSSTPSAWVDAQYNNGANQYINSSAAWARGWTGKGSTIMVMDTGIDVNNSAFAGKIKYQLDVTGTGLQDVVGHGTSIAGIAAGARNGVTPTGVAFDANLAVVKLSNTANIISGDAVGALAWAANKPDIIVANLSANTNYASSYTASVRNLSPGIYVSSDPNYGGNNYYNLESPQAWAQALTPKLAVTVSAGNQSVPYPQNPATFATATDANGKLLLNGQMLVVGNWNAQAGRIEGAGAGTVCKNVSGSTCLDQYKVSDFYILAPGMLVNSVSPTTVSATGTKAMSGTSQASAVAAGALAVVNQLWPYMTATNQVQLLLKTANKNLPGYNPDVMGQGLLDLDRATQPVGNLGIALNGRTSSTVRWYLSSKHIN